MDKDNKEKVFIGDKIALHILLPILKPFKVIYEYLYPDYIYKRFVLNKRDHCHCGSNEPYYKCCYNTDQNTKLKYYKTTRTNKKSGKCKTLYDFIEIKNKEIPNFCKGDINPLNKRGNYSESNISEGYFDACD